MSDSASWASPWPMEASSTNHTDTVPQSHGSVKYASTILTASHAVVETNLRLPSMVRGKKGFERLLYACKHVLTESLTWLFHDCNAAAAASSGGPIGMCISNCELSRSSFSTTTSHA